MWQFDTFSCEFNNSATHYNFAQIYKFMPTITPQYTSFNVKNTQLIPVYQYLIFFFFINLLDAYPSATIEYFFRTKKPSDKGHKYSIASLNVQRNLTYDLSTALPPGKIATLI